MPPNFKAAIALVAILLVAGVVWAVLRSSPSDEEQIRELIADSAAAFDARSMDCLDGFAVDYIDTKLRVRRNDLRDALAYAFFAERDPETWRVEVPPDQIECRALDPAAGTAEVAMTLTLRRGDEEAQREVWTVRVDAMLVRDDDAGWQFARSEHHTLRGRMPSR